MPVAQITSRSRRPVVCQIALVAVVLACGLVAHADAQTLSVRVDARALVPGELAVITVDSDSPVSFVRVRALGQDWPAYRVTPSRWRALVGIDLDTPAGPHPITITTDTSASSARYTLNVKARTFPTRRLTVDEAFVNPPEAETARIAQDAKDLAAVWADSAPVRLWADAFVRPVPQAANSAFGSRSILNGTPRNPHGGADFASPEGTPIKAPNGGRVMLARPLYFTGNTVVIDHGLGLFSLFAHLSTVDVALNDLVTTGQRIGLVGSTGRVTGPHLHWTVRANGARVDPLSLLDVLGQRPETTRAK